MGKWEYCRINSGKTITEKVQLGAQYPNIIPGKMIVWVVVFYYSHNNAAPELLHSQEVEFDYSRREYIRGFRISFMERAHVSTDEDSVPVFFLKRPIPE